MNSALAQQKGDVLCVGAEKSIIKRVGEAGRDEVVGLMGFFAQEEEEEEEEGKGGGEAVGGGGGGGGGR